jgi:hypothetical protein
MERDSKILIFVILGGISVTLRVAVAAWSNGLILRGVGVPSRDAAPLGWMTLFVPLLLALYWARPNSPLQLLFAALLFTIVTLVAGFFASAAVLSHWGVGF